MSVPNLPYPSGRSAQVWIGYRSPRQGITETQGWYPSQGSSHNKCFGQTETNHKLPKGHYVAQQISEIQARQSAIRQMRKKMTVVAPTNVGDNADLQHAYFIGASQNRLIDLVSFLQSNLSDSATKVR
jgi:hypothetical protein